MLPDPYEAMLLVLYELYALEVDVLSIIMVLVESIIIVLDESIIIELEESIIIELELSSIIMLLVDMDMSAIAVVVTYELPYAALDQIEKKRGEDKIRTQHEPPREPKTYDEEESELPYPYWGAALTTPAASAAALTNDVLK